MIKSMIMVALAICAISGALLIATFAVTLVILMIREIIKTLRRS